MAVPDFQSLMLPVLTYAGSRADEISVGEAVEALSKELCLTDDDLRELLPSGSQSKFMNRLAWAITYLKKAGLLEYTRRGFFKITKRGVDVLKSKPKSINIAFLNQYPEFLEFHGAKSKRTVDNRLGGAVTSDDVVTTPSEALESAYVELRDDLADELLVRLKKASPSFFERVVVELLVKMGYGGSRSDAGKAIGRSGDGGIDGIIKEDKLGLDVVYIQAKRWDANSVGRPDVMQFAGALQAQKANKGIFITTSKFTAEAKNYVSQIGCKIVLIDGEQLTTLMIENDVGVSTVSLYPLKRLDADFFEEST
ncbi:MAG: restriction endonuclease [Candidatus Zixiibacteriota bacterium]